MKAVVTGLIGAFPVGGVFWDYVQYALGLEDLGFDVWYLEDTTIPPLDVATGDYDLDLDWSATVAYLAAALAAVSPTLGRRWHFRGCDDRTYGVAVEEMADVIAEADLFLNVSGACVLRDAYRRGRTTVYLDTDPGWNHFMRWPRGANHPADHGLAGHDRFATYAERLGADDCPLPDLGLDWVATRPPVVTRLWASAQPPGEAWTTVLSWDNAPELIEHDGVTYGTKEREFGHVVDLPARSPAPLEVAASGARPPVEDWRARGWRVATATEVSRSPEAYRAYLHGSRGEFSVAKNVYVATRSGWFSCRSTCYLASGRPVVVQDTGFSQLLSTGEGIVPFADAEQALAGLRRVEDDLVGHAQAARALAAEHFEATRVLGDLGDRLHLNG